MSTASDQGPQGGMPGKQQGRLNVKQYAYTWEATYGLPSPFLPPPEGGLKLDLYLIRPSYDKGL